MGLVRDWLEGHPEYCGLNDGLIFEDIRHPYLNTDYDPSRWEVEAYDDKATYLVCTDIEGDYAGEIRIEYQGSHTYRNFADHRKATIMAQNGYNYEDASKGLAEGKYDVLKLDEWDESAVEHESAEKGGDITGEYMIVTYWI